MPTETLARFLTHKELRTVWVRRLPGACLIRCEKTTDFEVCPKCAQPAHGTYDRRVVKVKDAPVRRHLIILEIHKRRFWCKGCKKPFTEPVPGISKGFRTTHRYRSHVLWACEHFTDLKAVRHHVRCSTSSLYRILYERLELNLRKRTYPWPQVLGIDEHKFKRDPRGGWPIFATALVDHKNKRLYELVEGRAVPDVKEATKHIPGREGVKVVTMDLSSTYKRFVKDTFPNATIVADKFHVLRLLHPALTRARKKVTGDRRNLPVRKLLLKNGKDLDFHTKSTLWRWLQNYPELKELYRAKECLHGFYRIKGYERAKKALTAMLDDFGRSKIREIKTLRKTLMAWRHEILAYFQYRRTNGRTEGFNGKAKLVKRRAYGYRSFRNYRLRVLNACA